MKAKNILRISLFAVVLCLTLIFAAMADELDAKIIRWDGTGNVDIDSYDLRFEKQGLAVEETDGVLRVTGGSYDSVNKNSDTENFFFIRIAADDRIDLNTYPYYVIKFKTNDAYSADTVGSDVITQVYFLKANAKGYRYGEDGSGYHDCLVAPQGYDFTDMWRTYMYTFNTDSGVNKVSGQTLSEGEKLCGLRLSPAKHFKTDYETMANLVLDIEYIGFFKSKADAENYINRSSVIIRFDGNEDRAAVSLSGNGSPTVTDDGLCKITLDTKLVKNTGTAVAQPNFTLANAANLPYSIFSIDAYRYGTLKLKSTVNVPNFQLYTLQFNHLTKDNPYLYIGKDLPVSDDFQEYSFDAYGISNGSLLTGAEPKSHPNVTKPFMQFKGFTATGTTVETAEIKHIAYFKNADDRDAFVAGAMDKANDSVKAAYKKVANARNSVTVNTVDNAESVVAAKVEELLGSDSKVAANYATDGLKVIVTLAATETYDTDKNYTATKTVGFDVKLPEEDHSAKIIRFKKDSGGNVSYDIDRGATDDEGVFKIVMPADEAYYGSTSSSAKIKIAEADRINLDYYPYVKIKMRTNYNGTIQYYGGGSTANLLWLNDVSNIADGEWHEIETAFIEGSDYATVGATEQTVSEPFFQFKWLKGSPDGDLFAEIEYIAYFHTEEDMKNYGKEEDKVVLTGDELYSVVASSTSTELVEGNIIRIWSTEKDETKGTTVDISKVFDTVYGEKLDLYEYPYAKLKFRTTYTDTIQLYLFNKNTFSNYVAFDKNVKDGDWHNATLSYNYKDIAGGSNAGSTQNSIKLKTDDVEWEVKTINGGLFPGKTGEFMLDGFKIQLKNAFQENNYLDIAYIAFYKTKEAMLADTSYETDLDKVNEAISSLQHPEFTLHQSIGEIAVENYVREAIENGTKWPVSVVANAKDFDRTADTCKVEASVSCGNVTGTHTYTVTLSELDKITLENLGAQIRDESGEGETKIKQGLRFGTKLVYDENIYEVVSFGTVLVPEELLSGTYAFEKMSATGNANAGVKPHTYTNAETGKETTSWSDYKAQLAEGKLAYDFTDYKIFTAVLTGIEEDYYGVSIAARPYVTYKVKGDESGATYTYYGDIITRSVNQVEAAIEAGNANSTVDEGAKWSNTTND